MKRLGELASALDLDLQGDPDHQVERVASLEDAGPDALTFLADPRQRKHLQASRAGIVIVTPGDAARVPRNGLIAEDPHLAFARAARLLYPMTPRSDIHPLASLDSSASIGEHVAVDALASVGQHVRLEDGVQVGGGAVIGDHVTVGAGTIIHPRAVIMGRARIGARCQIHAGSVIGSEGFGFARDGHRWERVPQVGSVWLGDEVDVGANSTVDRGAIGNTVLEDGVKIDNLVQIGHNVHVGAHTAMAACVGISGSTRVGRYCTIAGAVGIAGHLVIADNVHITGMAQVTKSLTEPGVYSSGTGIEDNRSWRRNVARFHQLNDIARRLRQLEHKLGRED